MRGNGLQHHRKRPQRQGKRQCVGGIVAVRCIRQGRKPVQDRCVGSAIGDEVACDVVGQPEAPQHEEADRE
jgi:hypothetical protein